MSSDSESPAAGAAPGAAGPPTSSTRQRRLDRRTLGICICAALLAAIVAGLVADHLVGHDRTSAAPQGSLSTPNPDGALHAPLTTFDDKPTTLAGSVGTPLVVNLWSSTCPTCITEMPALERVHQRLKGRVTFVGVDVQDQTSDGRAMLRRTGVTYRALQDRAGSFARAAEAVGLPTTLLIDAKGHVVASHTGALSEAELERVVAEKLLR
ncbi:MAG: Thiol:disulfide oxidoreductase TlpA [Acidimicrobiales bacterium]|nr:Thiol:disulfide oxidoreductase TlpA [Acidimicrobiales bacterium]